MKKEGVIVGSTIQVNCAKLGFETVGRLHIYVLSDKREEIAKSVRKIKNISSVNYENIEPKLRAVFILKNLGELEKITHIVKLIPGVLTISSEIWIGIRNFLDNLSILPHSQQSVFVDLQKSIDENKIEKSKIITDELDNEIILKLEKNGRLPYSKIARELGVSTDTVSRRVKKLIDYKIIKPTIQINPAKLGYTAKGHLYLAFTSPDKLSTIVDCLSKIPDVTLIIKTSGSYDLFVKTYFKDFDHLFSIQNEISKISGISNVKIQILKLLPKIPRNYEYISTF